jgi:hypothetical protein
MNPLPIAGACSKRIDTRLIDRDPIRQTEFLSNSFAQTGEGEIAHVFPPRSFDF